MADAASFTTDNNATVARAFGAILALPIGYELLDPLRDELQQFVYVANGPASRYRDEEQKPFLLEEFGNRMFRAGATVHGAAMDHQRAHIEREAKHRKPAASIDRQHDAERRSRFRAVKPNAQMAALDTATLADLAALTVDGNLVPLTTEAFDEAETRYLTSNVIETKALDAQFAAKPTLTDPLPVGADVEAARRQADAIIKGHNAEKQVIAVHRRALQDYAAFLAVVFGMTAAETFDRIVRG